MTQTSEETMSCALPEPVRVRGNGLVYFVAAIIVLALLIVDLGVRLSHQEIRVEVLEQKVTRLQQ